MPYNIPDFKPFDFGRTIAQGENILAAKSRRDPNNPRNKLVDIQLQTGELELANAKKGPTKLSAIQEIPDMPGWVGQLNPDTNEWKNTKDLGDQYEGSFTLGDNRYTRDGKLLVKGAPTVDSQKADDKTLFDQTHKLRSQFLAETKPYSQINDAYTRITASAANPSPAGDMALIFNYMKMLDPGSVVRESEFQLAGDSGSLPQRIQTAYNKLATGEKLAAGMRADFVDRSKKLYVGARGDYNKRANQFTRIAKSFNLDPAQVIVNQSVADIPPEPPQGPIENPTPEQYQSLEMGDTYLWNGVPHIKGNR